jgi:hypothetical protein
MWVLAMTCCGNSKNYIQYNSSRLAESARAALSGQMALKFVVGFPFLGERVAVRSERMADSACDARRSFGLEMSCISRR